MIFFFLRHLDLVNTLLPLFLNEILFCMGITNIHLNINFSSAIFATVCSSGSISATNNPFLNSSWRSGLGVLQL